MVNSKLIEVLEDFTTISVSVGQTVVVDFQLLLKGAEQLSECSAISRDPLLDCTICSPTQLRITANHPGTATVISTISLLHTQDIVDRIGLVVQVAQAG